MTVDPDAKPDTEGDMDAFERIYRLHYQRVYFLCLRMIRNASQAEDLTQEIFLQVFRKLHTFRGDSLISTWLYRLAVNQVLMHFRKPIVKKERTSDDGDTPLRIVSGTENPSKMALIDRIALDEAVAQLAPGYRMVFILHDVEGYEHEQIGELLGCAVGTSKSQLHKARMKLRRILTSRQRSNQKIGKAQAQLNPHLKLRVQEWA